jgi:hypothetical protein
MAVKTKSAGKKSPYDIHPGVVMMQKWIGELPEKTGRSLEQWIKFIRKEGPADEKARRDWLKKDHGLGTNGAWWLAERAGDARDKGIMDDDPDSYLKAADVYVREMYAGGKAGLKPIHDRLIKLGQSIGKDVRICPCKTMVPLYRNHVFAQIKPTTLTRIDFGLALKGSNAKPTRRLIDTGGLTKGDRITHRIPITSIAEIDDEIKRWLKIAYDLDG